MVCLGVAASLQGVHLAVQILDHLHRDCGALRGPGLHGEGGVFFVPWSVYYTNVYCFEYCFVWRAQFCLLVDCITIELVLWLLHFNPITGAIQF